MPKSPSAPCLVLGNSKSDPSLSGRTCSRIASARGHKGTRWGLLAFMRSPGIVQVASSKEISDHFPNLTSPEREAVNTRNSKANLAASDVFATRTFLSAAPTSA